MLEHILCIVVIFVHCGARLSSANNKAIKSPIASPVDQFIYHSCYFALIRLTIKEGDCMNQSCGASRHSFDWCRVRY